MPERIFVHVNTDIDTTGFMIPRSIRWKDGRVFRIDSIRDFRPASVVDERIPGDCYHVFIKGQLKQLFFERGDTRFPACFGRWFVIKNLED